MLKAALVVTIAFVASVSVGATSAYAQVAQRSNVWVEPKASVDNVTFMKPNVTLGPLKWPVKGARRATRPAIRSDRFLQAPRSNRSGARARSKKRIVAGAIAGGVGGFLRADFSAPTSKVIDVTAMTPACAAS
jgi:hypothetical protein